MCSYVLETLFDAHKSAVDANLANLIPGTTRWYFNQCLEWQYGDALEWVNGKFNYATIDAAKQIIKFVSVYEEYGQVIIKVAKENSGLPVKLTSGDTEHGETTDELSAFTAYINAVKFAGTNLAVISYDPDLVNITLNVVYDPIVMNNDGSLISDNSQNVFFNLNNYLLSIVYGGVFNKTKCIDAIQALTGVMDVTISYVAAKAHNAESWNEITSQNYTSISGSYELSVYNLNMTPYV